MSANPQPLLAYLCLCPLASDSFCKAHNEPVLIVSNPACKSMGSVKMLAIHIWKLWEPQKYGGIYEMGSLLQRNYNVIGEAFVALGLGFPLVVFSRIYLEEKCQLVLT
ncbi:hypothetical protein BKA83DRAFT_4129423 [Pisolithus microcarpus]|nr:hypothetical protein BKA83DRAFT_4129423 [Pisolithus microcarpus]